MWHTFHGVFEALFKVMTAPFRLWLSVVKAVAGPIVSVIEWVVSKVEKLLHKIMGR